MMGEKAGETPRNLLDIPEMVQKVARHLLTEEINAPFFSGTVNPVSAFAATSPFFYGAVQGLRLAYLCALHTAQGNQEKVEKFFKISPAHIVYAFKKAHFEDFSGRKWYCSAWQIALWAGDWHMLTMMLKAFDEADEKAISKDVLDSLSEQDRRKQYLGVLTEEDIVALRIKRFEQYEEVVGQGLNYTIARCHRVLRGDGTYQLSEPRIVEVRGETRFDMKGPQFLLFPGEKFPVGKGEFYVRIEGDALHYRLRALSGQVVDGRILLTTLQCPLEQLDNPHQLEPYIHQILKITAQTNHTHPQALISAFETYVYGLNNQWNYAQLTEQWCGGVGMAEREVPAVLAQQMCRTDVLLGSFHEEFKERKFLFYNWAAGFFGTWFSSSSDSDNKLGLEFGIVNGLFDKPGGGGLSGRGGAGRQEPHRNLAALYALWQVRIKDIAELRHKVDPDNQQSLAPTKNPRMA